LKCRLWKAISFHLEIVCPILLVALYLFNYKYSCNFKLLPACYQNVVKLSGDIGSAFVLLFIYVFLLCLKNILPSNLGTSPL